MVCPCIGSFKTGLRDTVQALIRIEEFTSEVEAFASHLVLENQQLQTDNKQLNALLKEYETTLETVMSKFRGMSVSIS